MGKAGRASQDLERQLRENAEAVRRSVASRSRTNLGIASPTLGPLAMPGSAQGVQSGSRAAVQERWVGYSQLQIPIHPMWVSPCNASLYDGATSKRDDS